MRVAEMEAGRAAERAAELAVERAAAAGREHGCTRARRCRAHCGLRCRLVDWRLSWAARREHIGSKRPTAASGSAGAVHTAFCTHRFAHTLFADPLLLHTAYRIHTHAVHAPYTCRARIVHMPCTSLRRRRQHTWRQPSASSPCGHSGGCVTPLHYDLCHGFLVGVRGVKRLTYFSPDDFSALDARPEQPELSTVDLEAWRQGDATAAGRAERRAHARFAEATAWHAELRPGDVLYTPPFWWHHVETMTDSAALSVLVPFDPAPEEPVHPCHFR